MMLELLQNVQTKHYGCKIKTTTKQTTKKKSRIAEKLKYNYYIKQAWHMHSASLSFWSFENVSYFGRHGHCRTQFCCAHAKRCFADTQTYAKYRVCATVAKSVIQTVYICPILPLIVYVSIHLSNSICTSNREVIKIAQYFTEPPYLSSRNISFNSILARNMNIF